MEQQPKTSEPPPECTESGSEMDEIIKGIKAMPDSLHLSGVYNCCACNVFNKRNDTFLTGIHRQVIVIKN
jgi:hypothetical protein